MLTRLLGACAAAILISSAWVSTAAADSYFEAVPTAWRIQDFGDGNVTLYYTPSTCATGQVILTPGGSVDKVNRFWALILSAKLSGKVVGIYYNTTTCYITSFYLKEG